MAAYCNETGHLFEHSDPVALHHRAAICMAALPDYELLAIILRGKTAVQITRNLLARFGSIAGVFGASLRELQTCPGVGLAMATEIKAMHECSTRIMRGEMRKRTCITSWTALLAYAKCAMAGAGVEQFRVLFLDKKNQLIADEVLGTGTVDHAPVYPREIMKRALELDASAMILAHNHPSGDPTPSTADVEMTRQVADAGRPLRITVHDHIVVGRDGVASLKALGLF